MRQATLTITDEAVKAAVMRIAEGTGTADDVRAFTDYTQTDQGRADARQFTAQLDVTMPSRDVVKIAGSDGGPVQGLCAALIETDAEDLARRLAGPTSSAAVQALAALTAGAYVRYLSVANRYDAALRDGNAYNLTPWDRAMTAASMRYVKALDTLARVQRYEVMMTETQSADGDLSRSVRIKSS